MLSVDDGEYFKIREMQRAMVTKFSPWKEVIDLVVRTSLKLSARYPQTFSTKVSKGQQGYVCKFIGALSGLEWSSKQEGETSTFKLALLK